MHELPSKDSPRNAAAEFIPAAQTPTIELDAETSHAHLRASAVAVEGHIPAMALLREGVAAAKANDKSLARTRLLASINRDPRNETAWLWLASISDAPEDKLSCLQRALDINPTSPRALEWLEPAKMSLAHSLLARGVAAAKSHDIALAQNLLQRSAELDPTKELVWLWLASVASASEDKLAYLQRVLDINPAHETALEGFKNTKSRMARTLLQTGVAAAKEGKRELARDILRDVMEYDSGIEDAWLLLAYVTDALELKATYLQRALDINPASTRALSSLQSVQSQLALPAPSSWTCSLCLKESRGEARQDCTRCGSLLSLDDIDALLANDGIDADILNKAIERLRLRIEEDESDGKDSYLLGLALLNFGELDEGIAYLRASLRRDPANDELGRRIETLMEHRARRVAAAIKAAAVTHTSPIASAPVALDHTPVRETSFDREAFFNGEASFDDDASLHDSSSYIASVGVTASTAAAVQPARRTVMVVDDSPTVRKLVTIKLEKHGHRVIPAVDGMEALAMLNDHMPDLILLDVTMPRLDGYQLCKLVRGNSATKHIPIVMLSGKDGFFDKVRGRMAGSTAYITKPFEPETLLKVVDEYCSERRL